MPWGGRTGAVFVWFNFKTTHLCNYVNTALNPLDSFRQQFILQCDRHRITIYNTLYHAVHMSRAVKFWSYPCHCSPETFMYRIHTLDMRHLDSRKFIYYNFVLEVHKQYIKNASLHSTIKNISKHTNTS